mmetsp:Transcript_37146/g.94219  ORF Transcript_37146/g.94219 Transcript_37146/m.94219 type:complete len:258 (+) Transcript_37146:408-1181(+)
MPKSASAQKALSSSASHEVDVGMAKPCACSSMAKRDASSLRSKAITKVPLPFSGVSRPCSVYMPSSSRPLLKMSTHAASAPAPRSTSSASPYTVRGTGREAASRRVSSRAGRDEGEGGRSRSRSASRPRATPPASRARGGRFEGCSPRRGGVLRKSEDSLRCDERDDGGREDGEEAEGREEGEEERGRWGCSFLVRVYGEGPTPTPEWGGGPRGAPRPGVSRGLPPREVPSGRDARCRSSPLRLERVFRDFPPSPET